MRNHIKLFMLIVFICSVNTGCKQNNQQLTSREIYVFGTIVSVNVWDHRPENINKALEEIESYFQSMHKKWHAWKPGRLHEINQTLRKGKRILVSAEEKHVLNRIKTLSIKSQHTFNPAIGELINLWGFHTDEYPITTAPPTNKEIQSALKHNSRMDQLNIDGNTVSSKNPHIWLDFGGIAKGLAIDQAIQILQTHDIHHAIVNAGGDLRAIGKKDTNPWHIGIQSPFDNSHIAGIKISDDEAIFTSGNYYRYKQFDGQRYPHIINSQTGMPVNEIASATVIANDGMLADASATALIVAGSKKWAHIASQLNISQILIIYADGHCQSTAAMHSRLTDLQLDCDIVNIQQVK